jgi:hypothetical protein
MYLISKHKSKAHLVCPISKHKSKVHLRSFSHGLWCQHIRMRQKFGGFYTTREIFYRKYSRAVADVLGAVRACFLFVVK